MQTCAVLCVLLLATADDTTRLSVRRLVGQLDSPVLAQREEAERKLIELGPAALDLLPAINARTPAEIQQRIGRIRQKVERTASADAGRASLVTLKADAMPLSKVLATLSDQTGNQVVDYRKDFGHVVTDPPVTIELTKAPFWQAFDAVLDQAGMAVYPYGGQIRVIGRMQGQVARAAAACYAGPFRLEPIEVLAQRDVRMPANRSLRVMVEIAWEPRLKPIFFRQHMADVAVVDDHGQRVELQNPTADRELPITPGKSSTILELNLVSPLRSVEKISSLRGKMRALLPGRVETFRFDDPVAAKNVARRIGAVTVTLEQARKDGDAWEMRVLVRFDQPGQALETHRGWIHLNEVYVEGPDGKMVRDCSTEMTRQEENQFGLAYRFTGLSGPPRALVYKAPSTLLNTEFDYEFKDLPLP
jgi:hypothetical protein